jgi:hypothetical protein
VGRILDLSDDLPKYRLLSLANLSTDISIGVVCLFSHAQVDAKVAPSGTMIMAAIGIFPVDSWNASTSVHTVLVNILWLNLPLDHRVNQIAASGGHDLGCRHRTNFHVELEYTEHYKPDLGRRVAGICVSGIKDTIIAVSQSFGTHARRHRGTSV